MNHDIFSFSVDYELLPGPGLLGHQAWLLSPQFAGRAKSLRIVWNKLYPIVQTHRPNFNWAGLDAKDKVNTTDQRPKVKLNK